ncbi:MAG: alpha/beta family hydrolase [bacterium]|jgi:hypothetical protein
METFLDGPQGRLQASLSEPAGEELPRAACIVCHPHPERGGTLDTTVVFRIAQGLREAGVVALRFNFRGVGQSAGVYHGGRGSLGEEGDASAALDDLAARYPGLPLWAAGFSFGARTVAALAVREARIERVLLVALPVLAFDCSALEDLATDGLVVQGSADEFGTLEDIKVQFPSLHAGLQCTEFAAADHFFRRQTQELQAHISRQASSWLAAGPPKRLDDFPENA